MEVPLNIVKRTPLLLAVPLTVSILVITGFFLGTQFNVDQCTGSLPLLSERVCGDAYTIDKSAYVVLQNDVAAYIDERVLTGEISQASVYFRDLDSGPTFGVNEYNAVFPATLLKIILLTAYFDIAESYPELMIEKVALPDNPSQVFSVRELLQTMVHDAGDEKYFALRQHLHTLPGGEHILKGRVEELGLMINPASGIEESITVKNYSSMLHALFYARFLNPISANEVLTILADEDRVGIAAPVPSGITVAHRVGRPTRLLEGKIRMHDCGIVYYPDNPYSLCVAAIGHDQHAIQNVVSEIARMVYEEVNSRRNK